MVPLNFSFLYGAMIFSSAFNFSLFGPIRINDFLLFILLLCFGGRFKATEVLALFVLAFVSVLGGMDVFDSANPERLIFLYKYAVPFIIIWVIRGRDNSFYYVVGSYSFLVVLLSFWVFVSVFFRYDFLHLPYRPSYIFSNITDSHLLSSFLGFSACVVLVFKSLSLLTTKQFMFIFPIVVSAVLMSTGRGGLVLVTVFVLYRIFFSLSHFSGVFRINKFIALIGVLLIASISLFVYFDLVLELVGSSRTFNWRFDQDASSLARLSNLNLAFEESLNGFPLSSGLLGAYLVFYDGGLSFILAHFGLLLLGLFVVFLLRCLFLFHTVGGASLSGLLFVYIIENLITEYFMVSRSVIPSVAILFVLFSIYSRRKKLD